MYIYWILKKLNNKFFLVDIGEVINKKNYCVKKFVKYC